MSSSRKLYGLHISPVVRAVHMTLEALGVDYEFKALDAHGGEIRTPEFLKKNPQHTIPIFEEDDGTCIYDSHAIMAYLVRRYGKTDELYPKDLYKRAVVDQRLHYENGALFFALVKQVGKIMGDLVKKEKIPEIRNNIAEAYEMLETFLGDNQYIAGNDLTIADFSIVSSVTALNCLLPVETTKFPKLAAWLKRMKKLPYYDLVNQEGLNELHERLHEKFKEMQ